MARNRELTVRERNLIKGMAEGKNITQASLEAGYKHRESGSEALNRPAVRVALEKEFKKQGISDKCLVKVIKEGLGATKYTEKGLEVPDYATRHKYADMVNKMKGDYASEKLDVKMNQPVKQVINIIKFSEADVKQYYEGKPAQKPETENKSLKKS